MIFPRRLDNVGRPSGDTNKHCMKSVCNRTFSGPDFPAFELVFSPNAENTDQKNFEYGHFSPSEE